MTHNHRPGCACPHCRHPHPADRHNARARFWRHMLLWLALFWAFPGRWLIAAAWRALTLHHF